MSRKNRDRAGRRHELLKSTKQLAAAEAQPVPKPVSVQVPAPVAPPASKSPAADVSQAERREQIFAYHAHVGRRNYASGAGLRAGMTAAATLPK